jgi:hypothetical protein
MEMEGVSRANGAPIGGREEEGLSTGASTARSLSPPSHAGGGGRRFLVGEVGSDHIRNELSTKPPKKVFEEIQHSYGLQLPQDEYDSPHHLSSDFVFSIFTIIFVFQSIYLFFNSFVFCY